ncbi:MAG: hypothetical protein IT379_37680, partial [Deltaproteobacteria bacterium]|nr:hypothetical protein [Deltaproteobacteria bacterium]
MEPSDRMRAAWWIARRASSSVTAAALLSIAIGCGSDRPGARDPAPVGPARSATPSPAASVARSAAGTYEVHEWGLMRAGAGDALDVHTLGPPVPIEPSVVEKPVLYFHADGHVRIARVEVSAVGGSVREHWPVVSASVAESVAWRGLTLDPSRRAATPACPMPRLPSAAEPPCSSLAPGEACEASGLAAVVAAGATCVVRDGDATSPFLFYRSRTRTFSPPLRIVRAGADLHATNAGGSAIPGAILRIRRHVGSVRVIVSGAPAAGARVVIGHDYPADGGVDAGRRAVHETMTGLGLTSSETAAFLRAWDVALFSRAPQPASLGDRPTGGVTETPAATERARG